MASKLEGTNASSQTREYSNITFPESQLQHPRKAVSSIQQFFEEEISDFESSYRKVSFQMRSLANATLRVNEEEEDEKKGDAGFESKKRILRHSRPHSLCGQFL